MGSDASSAACLSTSSIIPTPNYETAELTTTCSVHASSVHTSSFTAPPLYKLVACEGLISSHSMSTSMTVGMPTIASILQSTAVGMPTIASSPLHLHHCIITVASSAHWRVATHCSSLIGTASASIPPLHTCQVSMCM